MNKRAQPSRLARNRAQRLETLDRVPREVFDLLAASPTPLKAYELLWRLQEKRGRRAPPSTIYRAVAVLIETDLVHKIESLSAFVVCTEEQVHNPIFLICEHCHRAVEIDGGAAMENVEVRLKEAEFHPLHLNFVIRGICAGCDRKAVRK